MGYAYLAAKGYIPKDFWGQDQKLKEEFKFHNIGIHLP
jgi:hypothetical protein